MARAERNLTAGVAARLERLRPGEAILLPVPEGVEARRFMLCVSARAGQVLGRGQYRCKTTTQGIHVTRSDSAGLGR